MLKTLKLSIKKTFIKFVFFALLIVGSSSVYAACTVNGTTENGAISLVNLKTAIATTTDDVSTCNVSTITNMSELFKNNAAFNQDISAWDTSAVTTMYSMFESAAAFNQDIGAWDVSAVLNMQNMFQFATAFNQDVSDWNTAAVTTMESMFQFATAFNQDISDWNTAAVTTMESMFQIATAFNQDISDWNTAEVTTMKKMFNGADAFNQDISDWNTAAVNNMEWMFYSADAFNNGGVALNWSNTAAVTNMNSMFQYADAFNQHISAWNTAAVTNMSSMFKNADAFNQDISAWNTGAVTTMQLMFYYADAFNNGGVALNWSNTAAMLNMQGMFAYAIAFNQNISAWDTSAVTDMKWMFFSATAFNQDISAWNTSAVTTMYSMFESATAFNQDISAWDVSGVTTMNGMFISVTLSTVNYDALLIAWDALELNDNINFHAGNSKYSTGSASTARASIISTDSWTITDGGTETTNPTLSSSTPADEATGVAGDANIVLTFSEAVDVESGNITIKKSSDDSTVETIAVTDSKITGAGTTTITINPAATLSSLTEYYVLIDATGFDDTSSNSYAGITDATTLNFTTIVTNLPTPLDKKDVIGSIEAWTDISSRWVNSNIESALGRIDWLSRHKGSNQTSHQGIKLNFVDTLINKIMNNSPSTALSDIDVVNTSAALIENSDGTLAEVSDNVESELSSIAINEAVIIREGLIGSLNPRFGPVVGDWSVWTEGKIVIGKTDASTTASKKKIDAQAITLGFDRPIGSGDELMGFVLSVGQDDADIGTGSTNVKSNNYSLSNYTVFKLSGNTIIESVLGLGNLDFDTIRTDDSDTLKGSRKANQMFFSSSLRPQNTINFGNWEFSPYSKVSFAKTNLKAFSESGASTALTYDKQKLNDTLMGIGVDINTQITTDNNTIKPFAKLEYARSSSKTSASMHYNNEDASTYTYTTSLNRKHKNWKMRLGLDLNTKSGWDMSVNYTREQSIGSSANSQNSNSFSFNADRRF